MVADGPGEAVANANSYSTYAVGYCLQWVRICWEVGSLYGSAIDAWNGARYKHPGDRNPPKGAPLFYRGGQYGHIVIAKDDGMRSTDCPSAGRVGNAALSWPETHWGQQYLGWTEDLNGVKLPGLSKDPTPDPEDKDMPDYNHARLTKETALAKGEWVPITWDAVPSGKAFTKGKPGADVGAATYASTLNVVVDCPEGASIDVQVVEWQDGKGAVENGPVSKFVNAGGWIRASVPAEGKVGKDRVLRYRVKCTAKATLKEADVVVLSWK